MIDAEQGQYSRLGARLKADGVGFSALLIQQGLAVPYDGGKKIKDWCGSIFLRREGILDHGNERRQFSAGMG